MKKIAALLVIVFALTIVGCQPPEQAGGVTQAQLDSLKTQIQSLQSQVDNIQTALDSLTTLYNAHIDKFHKRGGTKAPAPSKGGRTVKPPEKG
ncbi:hypothetical protein BXT86_05935 [candidate division WOR-3 bacterium 4484_100]|uniref:Uncharacterized protein n=1 Tax=candidate division WOR-3 bacterium 4484_100 TaxID=1936077 RepID=A0A1V4QDV6_UNCW3|nr:MAG: hypothetical protein BXT86_05935 [candidate division WOR-3 bacterium 4484_100]